MWMWIWMEGIIAGKMDGPARSAGGEEARGRGRATSKLSGDLALGKVGVCKRVERFYRPPPSIFLNRARPRADFLGNQSTIR
jgi:hypothetical protein